MTRMILALALHQGHIQDLAGVGSGCCPRLPNQLSMRQSCQEPDCAEKQDGITQCDSQARFHRSQVLGETIKNKQWERGCCGSMEQEWAASWSPRSHGSSPPLGQSPVRGAVSRSAVGRGESIQKISRGGPYLIHLQVRRTGTQQELRTISL